MFACCNVAAIHVLYFWKNMKSTTFRKIQTLALCTRLYKEFLMFNLGCWLLLFSPKHVLKSLRRGTEPSHAAM